LEQILTPDLSDVKPAPLQSGPDQMIKVALTVAFLKGALRPSSMAVFTWFTKPSGLHDPKTIRLAVSFFTIKIPEVLLLLIDVK